MQTSYLGMVCQCEQTKSRNTGTEAPPTSMLMLIFHNRCVKEAIDGFLCFLSVEDRGVPCVVCILGYELSAVYYLVVQ